VHYLVGAGDLGQQDVAAGRRQRSGLGSITKTD
jgi:hypothetical protein